MLQARDRRAGGPRRPPVRTARALAATAALLLLLLPAGWRGALAEEPPPADTPLRAWHFAEGSGRGDFRTFFSLLNLADEPAGVTAHYHREDGVRLVQWLGLPPRGRVSLDAGHVVGPHAFGSSFYADREIVVDRSATWGPEQHAETTLGFPTDGMRAWSFAEGTTRGRVSTYFVLQSLSDEPAAVHAAFVRDDGRAAARSLALAPRAREALRMDEILPDSAFGASFTADRDIVVERTILSEGPTGILGGPGYAPLGPEVGSRAWSFAEGSTRRPYQTTFILFNPNPEPAEARLEFRPEGGEPKTRRLVLPALGRAAVDPRDAVPAADFATAIVADRPIIAERAYYSTGDGLFGTLGHTPRPPRDGSRDWYFAEGNTTGRIETFFVVLNLSDGPARVEATLYPDGERPRGRVMAVPAFGRAAVRANDLLPGATFAARFAADRDVLVERTMHFPGWDGFTTLGAGLGQP